MPGDSLLASEMVTAFPTYESRLAGDLDWALLDADRFFAGTGEVSRTLKNIAGRLDDLGVPYAVVGGLAMFAHGHRRFTEDVDLLVTPESLASIHEHLEGGGYLPPSENSKHLRDTTTGVKVKFLSTGGFPGDGKPKPVAFPDPKDVAVEIGGVKHLSVPSLVSLRIVAGMTSPHRGKDLVDVQELIKTAGLPASFADELPEYVRDKFLELYRYAAEVDPFEQGQPPIGRRGGQDGRLAKQRRSVRTAISGI